jgi:hypothetical protein
MDFNLQNWYDGIVNILFELRNTQKTENSFKAKIKIKFPNGNIITYYGYTDDSNSFLICPNLRRIWVGLHPYSEDGIKTFYVSSKSGKTLDLEYLATISESVKYDAVISWKYLRTWIDLKVKDVTGSISLDLFDNNYGEDFTTQSFTVQSTKQLEFLSEPRRIVFIMAMLVSSLIGAGIFSVLTFILTVIGIATIFIVLHIQ